MEIKLSDISCTGCGACLLNCNASAITMVSGEDGFLYPEINRSKCIQCGQCMRSCHALGGIEYNKPSDCYAAQIKDKDVLFASSSGGLFYALASSIFEQHGIVYGCAFDENYDALIVRADSLEQAKPIHGSKYVWSDPSQSYPFVKSDLEKGFTVLYTCLPCQAAGLKKYLGKNYDNLFIVDVLCGGAPSPFAFQKYLETVTDNAGKKELQFQFRDKERFGSGVDCTYMNNGKKSYESWLENSFYFAFSSKSRITWRKSCYGCNYKSVNRVTDMTIGDYWGVEKHHSDFNPRDGVSVVLINTDKGNQLFDLIKDSVRYAESNVAFAIERNSLVNENEEGHVPVPKDRDNFFHTLCTDGWREADEKYLKLRKTLLRRQKMKRIPRKILHLLKK